MDTPSQNALNVQGAVAVTGWVLDDVETTEVKIYRNCLGGWDAPNCQTVAGQSMVFVGDAVFVPGARPDIELLFPTYPFKNRAGWGYMLLTLMMPHIPTDQAYGGQGTVQIFAVAGDGNGNKTILGRSSNPLDPDFSTPTTITMNNDAIAKPFGTIDTPIQGGTISGHFVNYYWALTPDANNQAGDILPPVDIFIEHLGLGAQLLVDGFALPVVSRDLLGYSMCRGTVGNPVPLFTYCDDDVASIFGHPTPQPYFTPRNSNPTKFRNLDVSRGAIGGAILHTEFIPNGVHTIQWTVTDSAFRAEGIGSRYFTVANAENQPLQSASAPAAELGEARSLDGLAPVIQGVSGRTGFNLADSMTAMHANEAGSYAVRLPESGRMELLLGPVEAGYLVANDTLRPLPIGSAIQGDRFAWMPPAGYVGPYHLAFVRGAERINVTVTVVEKPQAVDGEAQVRMQLDNAVLGASAFAAERAVRLDGWAFDPQAAIGAGIGAVHVWATPMEVYSGLRWGATANTPFFLGAATLDQPRPELGQSGDGARFAGFSLTSSLAPGRYVLTAYVWNERTARWEDARSMSVLVR